MKVLECSERRSGRGNVCLVLDEKDNTYGISISDWFGDDTTLWYVEKEVAVTSYNFLAEHRYGTGC
jgi:hypothetical protein